MSAFNELMSIRALPHPVAEEVHISGADPVLETQFKIAETAASVLAGIGVAINDLWDVKTGRRQQVTIGVRSAAAALRSKKLFGGTQRRRRL